MKSNPRNRVRRERIGKQSLINQCAPPEDCRPKQKHAQCHLGLSVSQSPDGVADTLFLIRNLNITALLGRIYPVRSSQLSMVLEKKPLRCSALSRISVSSHLYKLWKQVVGKVRQLRYLHPLVRSTQRVLDRKTRLENTGAPWLQFPAKVTSHRHF